MLPCAWTTAPCLTSARATTFRRATPRVTVSAAFPAKPPEIEAETWSMAPPASTSTLPTALTRLPAPSEASSVRLTTPMSKPTPTPKLLEKARLPAIPTSRLLARASTLTSESDSMPASVRAAAVRSVTNALTVS